MRRIYQGTTFDTWSSRGLVALTEPGRPGDSFTACMPDGSVVVCLTSDVKQITTPERFTFTFGSDHRHPLTGESLGRSYACAPEGVIYSGAWDWAASKFGVRNGVGQWAFDYSCPEAAGSVKYGLTEIEVTW